TETKKKRPCLIVSNNNYNHHFNTVLVAPISTSENYHALEKYVESPLFVAINPADIHGTALLKHIRAIDPARRSNGRVVANLSQPKSDSSSSMI
ncbi:type II toxin-antitoxin system PemK/MazF family toxin, partial [Lactobacillus sp. XV13L]|nr:type II toxin-antitoxin system PemK/MazF family toxin [Lactobacillus sp. XV13L]